MNPQIRLVLDTDILGSGCLRKRFIDYVEVLGHVVLREPRPTSLSQMAEASILPVAALKRLFRELGKAGILKKSRGSTDTWSLAKDPSHVTLEDVFRSAITACASRRRRCAASCSLLAGDLDVELLLMQASQAVDNQLYKDLRTYSLDRFKASSAVPFPLSSRHAPPTFAEIDQIT